MATTGEIAVVQRLSLLYEGLSGALAIESAWPEWLCRPGREWPLWLPVTQLAAQDQWPGMDRVVQAMAAVPAASRPRRQAAYETLLSGSDGPPIPLYESQFLGGRLLGPEMRAVESLYRQLGLELQGAELPDHAAVELEFLAWLAEREIDDPEHRADWHRARQRFVKLHAGRWLPEIGKRLSQSPDMAWSTLGGMLQALLRPTRRQNGSRPREVGLPRITSVNDCSLCGFCAQVCPTQAVWIAEDQETTRLYLNPNLCVRCRKCERVCDARAISMDGDVRPSVMILRSSSRAICPCCGTATVSRAELDAIASRLGDHPAWLDYCLDCRALYQRWN
jgi:TorA maturation chaperone TorD